MARLTTLPTTATLMRFTIDPDKLPEGLEVWTLSFPSSFRDALWDFKTKVENRVKNKVKGEYIGVPYRQLNNVLLAICPTLMHGFEYAGKNKPYWAVAVGELSELTQLPDPENIRHIIREWAQLWTEQPYIVSNIPQDEQKTMQAKLMAAINTPVDNWDWNRIPANQLLTSFKPKEALNYTAIPSLMAALLHGTESTIHGKQVQWRKVQDSNSQKLSIVGFVNHRPIWARYTINEYKMKKSGEGFGAYKLEFSLETQTGRDIPWMFVSLHTQRYGHEALTEPNHRRRVSILAAANRYQLDDFLIDSTLVKLYTSENGEKVFEWDDNLVELLERIGAIPLETPNNILNIPQNYWHPSGIAPDYSKDEYYIIHAEGYGYGDDKAGHQLEAGFSMTDNTIVFEQVMENHLTMLERDKPLETDKRPFANVKTPRAMRDYQFLSEPRRLKSGEMEQMLHRALRGQEMLITILWENEDTRDGIFMALREALLLKTQEPFPSNITITNHRVETVLLEAIDRNNFNQSYQQRIRDWRKFLQSQIPKHSNCFAIIEMLKSSWKVKDAARTACVKEGITSQMVRPIRLKLNKSGEQVYLGGPNNHEHRANSVAREVVLRHIGGLYGSPQEIYQAAGVKDENLEVITFFLKQTQGNISYPIATKLAFDGAVEVMLPDQKEWILYGNAAPILGQIFAKERTNVIYDGSKRKIRDDKKKDSVLYYEKSALNNFVRQVIERLQYPTIVVIEADKWRNTDVWPQLRNPDLIENWNVLNFEPYGYIERNDPKIGNLLAVIRMRSGIETPQYLTDTQREFTQLTGAVDTTTGKLMHYFSIGRQLVTSKGQGYPSTRHATMLDGIGAGVAYKYPQVVEFLPFFVRDDYQTLEGLKQLCRVPHYLRISPAWPQGNIIHPYPMHLARELVNDQLCILGMED